MWEFRYFHHRLKYKKGIADWMAQRKKGSFFDKTEAFFYIPESEMSELSSDSQFRR